MRTIIRIIVITAAVLIAGGFFTSCNPAKQAAKKDARATARVLERPALFEHVGKIWARLNPCVNDTATRIDTIIEPVIVDAEIDADSLRRVLCDTSKSKPSVIYIPVPGSDRTIRITNTVIDTRAVALARDSLRTETRRADAAESRISGQDKTIEDLRVELRDTTKDFGRDLTRRTLVILIPAILIIALLLFALFKRKRSGG